MTEERAFLDAIIADPDDDTTRLVFADWLEEHGESARAEFIRVQVELARTNPDSAEWAERRRSVLFVRQDELLKKHKGEWLAPFAPFGKESSFERGFVQFLSVPASAFLQHAERWYAITPLTRARFTQCAVWDSGLWLWVAAELLSSPLLSPLAAIAIEQQGLTPGALETLAEHPDLSRLRHLELPGNSLGGDGAAILAGMPQLRNLESLDLQNNGITDAGARALARSPYLGALKELFISRNPIHDPAWAELEARFGDALVC